MQHKILFNCDLSKIILFNSTTTITGAYKRGQFCTNACNNFVEPKGHTTTAVNSVKQDICIQYVMNSEVIYMLSRQRVMQYYGARGIWYTSVAKMLNAALYINTLSSEYNKMQLKLLIYSNVNYIMYIVHEIEPSIIESTVVNYIVIYEICLQLL